MFEPDSLCQICATSIYPSRRFSTEHGHVLDLSGQREMAGWITDQRISDHLEDGCRPQRTDREISRFVCAGSSARSRTICPGKGSCESHHHQCRWKIL